MGMSQGWPVAVSGVVVAVICLALAAYYGVAAAGHPHLKHVLLFIVLAAAGLLISWFSVPKRAT